MERHYQPEKIYNDGGDGAALMVHFWQRGTDDRHVVPLSAAYHSLFLRFLLLLLL